jgi:hypothetical protein
MHLYSAKDDCLESFSLESARIINKIINLHADSGSYGPHRMAVRGNLGICYVKVACRKGSAHAIAQVYREILGCTVLETPSIAVVCALNVVTKESTCY